MITRTLYGITKKNKPVYAYTLTNENGMSATILNYGAILANLIVPNQNGQKDDVVLGFDTVEEYETNVSYFGATIGRSANRTEGAIITIDEMDYFLPANEGENNLHSSFHHGFHKRIWNVKRDEENNAVTCFLHSPNLDMGFPGDANFTVTYQLTKENELRLTYTGISSEPTVMNLTNHSYFNLNGHNSGSILGHEVMIQADAFTEVKEGSIPTGTLIPVKETPLDFTNKKVVGRDIEADYEQLDMAGGFDHNFVLDQTSNGIRKIAEVSNEDNTRRMEVFTDLPGVQFYTGNFIDTQTGKGGCTYKKRDGLCLETQFFPNAVNQKEFVSPVFTEFQTETVYKFSW